MPKNNPEKEEFFRKVSLDSKYIDPKIVKEVFYGMLRTIGLGLKYTHSIILPDLGELYVIIRPSKRRLDIHTKTVRIAPATPIIKFKPDYKFNAFIKGLKNEDLTKKK